MALGLPGPGQKLHQSDRRGLVPVDDVVDLFGTSFSGDDYDEDDDLFGDVDEGEAVEEDGGDDLFGDDGDDDEGMFADDDEDDLFGDDDDNDIMIVIMMTT